MSTSNEMAPSFGGGFGGFGGFDRPSMPFNPFMMTRGIGYNPNRNDIDDYIRKYKNSDYIRRLPSVQDENCKLKTARLMLVTFFICQRSVNTPKTVTNTNTVSPTR